MNSALIKTLINLIGPLLYIHQVPTHDKQRDQMIIDHNICNYIVDTLFGIYLLNVQGKI